MSGHSKWATIKRKKEKTDNERGKIFTKIGRELVVAVREGGGGDPESNARLRDCIAKAKANNMPNDNIQRSIKKALGEGASVHYEDVVYEGYGPSGVAVIVEVLTDNRNRTAAEIRHIFDRAGGALGATGCVGWMFDRKGIIIIEKGKNVDEDTLTMAALEAGALDVADVEDAFEISTEPADFSTVREALEKDGYTFISAEVTMIPQNTVTVTDDAVVQQVLSMIDKLDDHEDVSNAYHNADLPEDEGEE